LRALLASSVAAGVLALASGCKGGGVSAADLFVVTRTGSSPQAHLTLLVNEEGGINCNGGPTLELDDAQLLKARGIQEDLHDPASKNLRLPARPGSVLKYSARDENGTVTFADNSPDQPKVLRELALFVVQTAQQVCHLPE
jgi:hypothetical protein